MDINNANDDKKRLNESKRRVAELDKEIVGMKPSQSLIAPHRVLMREVRI